MTNNTIEQLIITMTNDTRRRSHWLPLVFVNQTLDQDVEDPFDSIGLKLIAVGAYIISLFSSGIMLAFITYEKKYHGHFRTLINQLLSNFYAVVYIILFKLTVMF